MKKRIVIIILILAAAGAAVYAFRGSGQEPNNRIVVSGNIELTEVNIAFKTAGRLIERTVDEGDDVKKGQVIARLDRDQLLAQQNRETAGLQSTRGPTRAGPDRPRVAACHAGGRPGTAARGSGGAGGAAGGTAKRSASAGAAGRAGGRRFRAVRSGPGQERLGARAGSPQERRHLHRPVRPVPHALGERPGCPEIGQRAAGAGARRAARRADQRAGRAGGTGARRASRWPRRTASN